MIVTQVVDGGRLICKWKERFEKLRTPKRYPNPFLDRNSIIFIAIKTMHRTILVIQVLKRFLAHSLPYSTEIPLILTVHVGNWTSKLYQNTFFHLLLRAHSVTRKWTQTLFFRAIPKLTIKIETSLMYIIADFYFIIVLYFMMFSH